MRKTVLYNVLMNVALTVILVLLSNRALRSGLEETLVAYALVFGIAIAAANAVYVSALARKGSIG